MSIVLHKADATNVDDYVELGYIEIHFSSPLKYYVHFCYEKKWEKAEFPTPPSADQNKIWTITKTFTDLAIDCNGVRVLDFNFEEYSHSGCAEKWSQDVAKIVFFDDGDPADVDDNASDMYRRMPTCDSLPNTANLELETGSQLPVNQGTKITVKCTDGYSLEGDRVITCQHGNVFTGNPSCLRIGT